MLCVCLQFIEIQPNDGFGTLLPQETLEINLIFSPKKAQEYHFQLSCQSGVNRLTFIFLTECAWVSCEDFQNDWTWLPTKAFFLNTREFLLSCRAVGVHPPLELSRSLVQFRATAVGDKSTAVFHLISHHADNNQFKRTVTPVATDTVTVEVPRLFCFTPPEDSDISISPAAGRLLPGEVEYTPFYLHAYIHTQAAVLNNCTSSVSLGELGRK